MKLTTMWGNRRTAYRTIEEAIGATDFSPFELNNSVAISVGIGIDADGQKWYAVGGEDEFTNCEFRDLKSVDDWYESDWIEREI